MDWVVNLYSGYISVVEKMLLFPFTVDFLISGFLTVKLFTHPDRRIASSTTVETLIITIMHNRHKSFHAVKLQL